MSKRSLKEIKREISKAMEEWLDTPQTLGKDIKITIPNKGNGKCK